MGLATSEGGISREWKRSRLFSQQGRFLPASVSPPPPVFSLYLTLLRSTTKVPFALPFPPPRDVAASNSLSFSAHISPSFPLSLFSYPQISGSECLMLCRSRRAGKTFRYIPTGTSLAFAKISRVLSHRENTPIAKKKPRKKYL